MAFQRFEHTSPALGVVCLKYIMVHHTKIFIHTHGTPHFWKLWQKNATCDIFSAMRIPVLLPINILTHILWRSLTCPKPLHGFSKRFKRAVPKHLIQNRNHSLIISVSPIGARTLQMLFPCSPPSGRLHPDPFSPSPVLDRKITSLG